MCHLLLALQADVGSGVGGDVSEALDRKLERTDMDAPISSILEMFKTEMNAVRSRRHTHSAQLTVSRSC